MTIELAGEVKRASIGHMIRLAVQEGGRTEPSEIADLVIESIPETEYRSYLRELILTRISSELGEMRGKVTPDRKSMSTKQALIRDQYWPAFLNQFISLPTGYKKLAEATAEDLRFISNVRRSQANDLLSKAEQFSTLADLMDEANVRYLEQLDPKAGKRILERH